LARAFVCTAVHASQHLPAGGLMRVSVSASAGAGGVSNRAFRFEFRRSTSPASALLIGDVMDYSTLSTTDLLARAADAARTDASGVDRVRWGLVYELHDRATREVFTAAAAWCRAPDVALRNLGVDILAELGMEADFPFARESEPVLLTLLDDPAATVVAGAARALGSLGADDTAGLCRIAGHPVAEVRVALARSLCELCGPGVMPTLLALSRDAEVEVRRLAASGLTGLDREDTEEIRLALVERLRDEDAETREEAIFGLAMLDDDRVDEALRAAKEEPDTSELIEMAAMHLECRRDPDAKPLPRPRRPN
jgi:HEAT repeat protein